MTFLELLQSQITLLGNLKNDKLFESELRHLPWDQIGDSWNQKEILSYLAKSPKLPCQKYEAKGFGEANITLFTHRNVSVDLYFPGFIPTDFHQHSFHGAFFVLQGSYIHETLDVTFGKKIKPGIFETNVNQQLSQKLTKGSIVYLSDFDWHRLWRLNSKGVSLLIRKETKNKIKQGIL